MADRILRVLGLAQKAGKLASGEEMTLASVRNGSARLVLVASDASDNTKKLFQDKCAYYKVPLKEYGTKETLGRAIGRAERSSIAIEDEGFAEVLY